MHEGVRLLHQTEMRRFGLTSPLPYCGAESLQDVTGRQWFAREWTIQEAAMASEGYVAPEGFVFGDHKTSVTQK